MGDNHVLIGVANVFVKDDEVAARLEELQSKAPNSGECDAIFHRNPPFLSL
jgi:hypothetical protein